MVERKQPVRRIMRALKIDEISAVDNPAQSLATMAIMKRASEASDQAASELAKSLEAVDFDTVLAAREAAETAEEVVESLREKWSALQSAFISIAMDESTGAPQKIPLLQESLRQFIDSLSEQSSEIADSLNKALAAVPALAELLPPGSEGDLSMTDAEKRQLAELQKTIEDLTKKLEAATSKEAAKKAAQLTEELTKAQDELAEVTKKLEAIEAEKAEAVAKASMTDAEKAFCADMPPAEKAKFMTMSPADRAKAMKKSADSDPVVYKSESTGEEFRKSDDPRLVKMAKQADEDRALAKAEREARENAEFAKRADDELGVFSEEVAKRGEKIEVIRAISKMDEGPRTAITKMLAVGGKAITAAFDTIGHRGEEVAKAAGAFEKRVSEVQARDKCTKVAALERAREEFPEEFKAYQNLGN